MPFDVGPMIVKIRKGAGHSWRLLVSEDLGPEATLAEAIRSRDRMCRIGNAFKDEFTEEGKLVAKVHGPLPNLRQDHLSIHMWLNLERPGPWPKKYPLLGVAEHERLVAFFHSYGLDVVGRSFPRRMEGS